MSDDLKHKAPADTKKINLQEKWEVDYWCKKLHTNKTKLSRAVSESGADVTHVKEWLGNH
jgi:hypothetical protein